ncbi:FAD-dependent monooxygenase [Paenibacillus sp. CGMCC 1.16610]|uniref:FAD dependent oxidoreductase n=1 Tax=Paenibacillus anseongense TaxID=2682845 RepID=A0ABW9UBI2_9BACL|nr:MULTISPECIES: FAD-dependent monooxygenase [Paenibacillus]MBA2937592.1 FAD-dependent monooxygenase [Paenibacillus sp. CGMCC 1.16610]MVQ36650.1 FAD dependent oxidoreductase [Paenibacillus anseongense]
MNFVQKASKAIVIGGSMAGLMTARVLSSYYEEVLLIDKDEFPQQPADRNGTPHGFHPHRFTQRGKMITEQLFPGYEEDLVALGSPSSLHKTVHMMNQYGTVEAPYQRNDMKFSRAVLEWVIRGRVRKIPNVQLLEEHDVIGLHTSRNHTAVTGIQVRQRGAGIKHDYMADLVVDASGRSSKLTQWLKEFGYDVPSPDRMKAAIGYSTRRYNVPAHMKHLIEKWDVINIMGQPVQGTFTGVFSFIENEVAEMLLYRPGGHYPPTNPEDFEREVAQLPSPLIGEILSELEPITPPKGFRVPELYRHHYDQMDKWPDGLLVLGDAYCIYDPIFGQGMTVAAIEADLLDTMLQERQNHSEPHFEQRVLRTFQEKAITPAWWLNCAADMQWDGVEYEAGSEPLEGIAFGSRYMNMILREGTANHNFKLFGLYWGVNSLSLPLHELFQPQMVKSVLESSEEGQQLLADLLREYELPLEEVLIKLIPS